MDGIKRGDKTEDNTQVSISGDKGSFWLDIIKPEYMSPIGKINLIFGVLSTIFLITCLILVPITEAISLFYMFSGITAFFIISLFIVGMYESKVLNFKKFFIIKSYAPPSSIEQFPRDLSTFEHIVYAALFAIFIHACFKFYETGEFLNLIQLVIAFILLIIFFLIFRRIEKNKS